MCADEVRVQCISMHPDESPFFCLLPLYGAKGDESCTQLETLNDKDFFSAEESQGQT